MKKLLYLFGLIVLIGCQDESTKIKKIECQLRYVKGDTVYSKTDSTNMVITNITHDDIYKHDTCLYWVLFRLNNKYEIKKVVDNQIY